MGHIDGEKQGGDEGRYDVMRDDFEGVGGGGGVSLQRNS